MRNAKRRWATDPESEGRQKKAETYPTHTHTLSLALSAFLSFFLTPTHTHMISEAQRGAALAADDGGHAELR